MACMVSVGTVKPQIDCGAPSCQAGKYIISEYNSYCSHTGLVSLLPLQTMDAYIDCESL